MTNYKERLNALEMSDVYSLLLFVLYKMKDVPDYATLSAMCNIVDSRSLTRLLTYFAGKTVTFPTAAEMKTMADVLLIYNDVNLGGREFADAMADLQDVTKEEQEKITKLYLQVIDVMKDYSINMPARSQDDR